MSHTDLGNCFEHGRMDKAVIDAHLKKLCEESINRCPHCRVKMERLDDDSLCCPKCGTSYIIEEEDHATV